MVCNGKNNPGYPQRLSLFTPQAGSYSMVSQLKPKMQILSIIK
jgi:hypothetical protein